jgi:PPP family 3-phenylpropionic acid transporter
MAVGAWLDYRSVDTLPAVLLVASLLTLGAALTLPVQRVAAAPQPSGLIMTSQARMLIGAGFCMTVAHGALYAFLTLFLQAEGYSGSAIGLLWTVGVLAEVAVFFYLPALFRRYSLATLLLASFAIAVLRFLAIGWGVGLFWLLLAAQLMHAATFGSFHAASVAAVRRVFPEHAQGLGQTLFSSLSYGAGGAAGVLLAGWTWAAAGPELAFSVSSLAALAGFFLSLRLKRAGF